MKANVERGGGEFKPVAGNVASQSLQLALIFGRQSEKCTLGE